MGDIVLDSNILADLLAQWFGGTKRGKFRFVSKDTISENLVRRINHLVSSSGWDREEVKMDKHTGLIAASAFAFVEITRKWQAIVRERFTVEEMAGFIEQPPEWFVIDPIDESLVEALSTLAIDVLMDSGEPKTIEWTDAVHITTALSRGALCKLATTDGRIKQFKALKDRLL